MSKVEDETGEKPPVSKHEIISRVKMPNFCHSSPSTWFALVESTFAINNIKTDVLKYHHVLTALPEDILMTITDVINNPPENDKFVKIKDTVISRHSESESLRLQKLLGGVAIGDNTPSQYFRQLQLISGSSNVLPDDVLKHIWLGGLPTHIKSILVAATTSDIASLMKMADKIFEVGNTTPVVASTSTDPLVDRLNALEKQIEKLTICSTKKYDRSRSAYRYQKEYRGRSRSKSQVNKYPTCYFHHRFGKDARNCRKPCDFETKNNQKN